MSKSATATHRMMVGSRGKVHYWISGEGDPAIVFTHGATMDHGLFQLQMEYFSSRCTVISWDVPMHGQSRPYDGFSLQNAARELIAILDAESIDRAHLVGQSMGGYISQIAASDHPERVRTITAVDSSPIQLSYYSALDRWLLSITPNLLKLYPYSTLIKLTANQIAIDPSSRAYALGVLETHTKEEIAHIMSAVYGGLIHLDRSILSCPILVLYGDSDRTGKVKSYCNRWAEQEERELGIISNAAHNANMDNPEEFNQILSEFLGMA